MVTHLQDLINYVRQLNEDIEIKGNSRELLSKENVKTNNFIHFRPSLNVFFYFYTKIKCDFPIILLK